MIPNNAITKLSQLVSDLADQWITFEDEAEPDLTPADPAILTEACIEFANLCRERDNSKGESFGPDLVRIAIQELVPEVKLLACAALREVAHEFISHTIAMLSHRPKWEGANQHDRELHKLIRLVAAAACGLMADRAVEAI